MIFFILITLIILINTSLKQSIFNKYIPKIDNNNKFLFFFNLSLENKNYGYYVFIILWKDNCGFYG